MQFQYKNILIFFLVLTPAEKLSNSQIEHFRFQFFFVMLLKIEFWEKSESFKPIGGLLQNLLIKV